MYRGLLRRFSPPCRRELNAACENADGPKVTALLAQFRLADRQGFAGAQDVLQTWAECCALENRFVSAPSGAQSVSWLFGQLAGAGCARAEPSPAGNSASRRHLPCMYFTPRDESACCASSVAKRAAAPRASLCGEGILQWKVHGSSSWPLPPAEPCGISALGSYWARGFGVFIGGPHLQGTGCELGACRFWGLPEPFVPSDSEPRPCCAKSCAPKNVQQGGGPKSDQHFSG